MSELQAGGRQAMRDWISERSAEVRSKTRRPVRELQACFELAALIYNESGGDLIADAIAEAEARIIAAQDVALDAPSRGRMAANLGALYERAVGDPANARRWYEAALKESSQDEVALKGLARLTRSKVVAVRKTLESDRARELERAFQELAKKPPAEVKPDRTAAQN